MKTKQSTEPETPKRDFAKETEAMQAILDALKPFDKETQTRLIKTVVVFSNIYITNDY